MNTRQKTREFIRRRAGSAEHVTGHLHASVARNDALTMDPVSPVVEPPPEAARILLLAGDAAVSWWRAKKPVGWGVRKHLQNPAVNCVTERERRLARAAARWYAIQHPSTEASDEKNLETFGVGLTPRAGE